MKSLWSLQHSVSKLVIWVHITYHDVTALTSLCSVVKNKYASIIKHAHFSAIANKQKGQD
jgi:hypothetical protein